MILKHKDDTTFVHLCGSLTHAEFERFNAVLDHVDHVGPTHMVLDMSEVTFIDSSGIGMLLMAQEMAEHRECACRLRGVLPAAWSILEQAHVSDLFVVEGPPTGFPSGHAGSAAA
jgi:anti-anti-sigma factor